MPEIVQYVLIFVGALLLARIIDEVFIRWRKRRDDKEKDSRP